VAKAIRKKIIVKRDFQLQIFFETLILLFFVAVIVGWTVYLGVFKVILFEFSGEKLTLINKFISFKMFLWFLPSVIAILIISIFLSHQIAGPIFVFQRTINALVKGEPVRKIVLRKYDKLQDFADDVNKLIDYFENKKES
jgi:signal transduction histidine kinase